jgi:Mce-associated membrane protein
MQDGVVGDGRYRDRAGAGNRKRERGTDPDQPHDGRVSHDTCDREAGLGGLGSVTSTFGRCDGMDSERADVTTPASTGGDRVDVLAELAEAEAEEADAREQALLAKERAQRLRNPGSVGGEDGSPAPVDRSTGRPSLPRWWRAAALAACALAIGGLVALTGIMISKHKQVSAERAHDREVVEAADNGVVALLSIDHSRAQADVQKVLDLSIGAFHDDFASRAADFIQTAQDSKAVTVGSVTASALESATADSAIVLLAASSQVTNVNGARGDPRPWRMSVTMSRDEDKWKMSNVEFVP